ncbi:zinc finger protein 696-like isoform X2 [Denticeps clupeoides]|uniref:zinc finger protein 696-like isoform X2 n=1 Tax=Denticeps clupeoides TaxID=299321 RepID=UPI0010A45EF0|nr:zinc finger protein 696-like isoform X2 [Denticeps clupeoides]
MSNQEMQEAGLMIGQKRLKTEVEDAPDLNTGATSECPGAPGDMCQVPYASAVELESHRQLHGFDKPFPCAQCGKRFLYRSHQLQHQRTHLGERPFSCGRCGRAFSTPFNLRRHERLHKEEETAELGTRPRVKREPGLLLHGDEETGAGRTSPDGRLKKKTKKKRFAETPPTSARPPAAFQEWQGFGGTTTNKVASATKTGLLRIAYDIEVVL